MSDTLNESDFLGYVEDDLDPEASAALRDRLARDDELREKLDRLCRDRAVLRSLEEPEIPADFIASLEANLVRPMLIESRPDMSRKSPMRQPGVYRRRHRPASRGRRVARYAAAAIVVLALIAGIWITSSVRSTIAPQPGMGGDSSRTVTAATDDPSQGANAPPAGREDAGAPANALAAGDDAIDPGAEVHHSGPLPLTAPAMVARDASRAVDGRASVLAAPLVLVLAADDVGAAEARLQRAVAGLTADSDPSSPDQVATALVRNFSMAEARRLEERYFPGRAGDPQPDAVAGLGAGDANDANDANDAGAANLRRQRERLAGMLDSLRNRPRNAEDEPVLESRLLYGAEGLASYEKQLELSGRGASYTIAVPADAFGALLCGLHRFDGPAATLRSFDGWTDADASDGEAQTIDEWIAERRAIDAFLATLRAPGASGSTLLVPVVIE